MVLLKITSFWDHHHWLLASCVNQTLNTWVKLPGTQESTTYLNHLTFYNVRLPWSSSHADPWWISLLHALVSVWVRVLVCVCVCVCVWLVFFCEENLKNRLLFSHNEKIKTCKNFLICNPNYTYTRIQDISFHFQRPQPKEQQEKENNLYILQFMVSSQLESTREHLGKSSAGRI